MGIALTYKMIQVAFVFGLILNFGIIKLIMKSKRERVLLPFSLLIIPSLLYWLCGFNYQMVGLSLGLFIIIGGDLINRRFGLDSSFQLLWLLLAGALAYQFGFKIQFITNPQGGYYYLNLLSLPLTLAWIMIVPYTLKQLAVLNSKLLLPVILVSCTSFLIVNRIVYRPDEFSGYLILILMGYVVGFIFSSVNGSARNHSINTGLGFCIALICIAGMLKVTASMTLIAPFLILSAPLMTTSYGLTYWQRSTSQVKVLEFMKKRGMSFTGAVLLIYLIFSYITLGLIILSRSTNLCSISSFVAVFIMGLIIFIKRKALVNTDFRALQNRVSISKIPINRLDGEGAVKKLERFIQSKKSGRIVLTIDTPSLMRTRLNPEIKRIYQHADLVTPDGIGVVWACRFLGQPLPERVTGIDMVYKLCAIAASKGYSLFLLGSKDGVARRAKVRLEEKFPGLTVAGTHSGYFKRNGKVIEKIKSANPDILLVGMGFPKQERWIDENINKIGVSFAMGVGGSFDVISGKLPRAPQMVQNLGLEWLYRLLLEPRRLPRSSYIPLFMVNILLIKLLKQV